MDHCGCRPSVCISSNGWRLQPAQKNCDMKWLIVEILAFFPSIKRPRRTCSLLALVPALFCHSGVGVVFVPSYSTSRPLFLYCVHASSTSLQKQRCPASSVLLPCTILS